MKTAATIVTVMLVVLIPAIFSDWGLTESSEARYAEISREMYLSGDFVNPTLLGIKHFHKPPITYYITSAGYTIFGIGEVGARFFLAIALLLQLFLVYRITDLLYKDKRVSTAALLIYFSFPITQIAAKNLTTDCYLTTFISAGIYFLLSHFASGKKAWLYLFYASCGLAFLTKGPVGILPQVLFAIAYRVILKQKLKFTVHHLIGMLAGVIVSISWFGILLYHNPHLLEYFIGHQIVDRVASDSFSRAKPIWYYILTMPLIGVPAMLFFINYGLSNIKKFRIVNPINRVLVIVLLVCGALFSLASSKLILYVLPLYLFIAMISAKNLLLISSARSRLLLNSITGFFIVLFTALLLTAIFQYPIKLPVWPVSLLSVSSIISLMLVRSGLKIAQFMRAPLGAATGMAFVVAMLPTIAKHNEFAINSIKPIAKIISKENTRKVKSIIVYNQFLPSLEFYTNTRIITVNNGNTKTQREVQFEDSPYSYKNSYYQLPEDSARLKIFTSQHEVIVVAKITDPVPDSISYLKNTNKRIVAGNWAIELTQ
jgi:4-amino-4-deoxy-L-arabinose transferase-like glycosyltransferase